MTNRDPPRVIQASSFVIPSSLVISHSSFPCPGAEAKRHRETHLARLLHFRLTSRPSSDDRRPPAAVCSGKKGRSHVAATIGQLAELVQGRVVGDATLEITAALPLGEAGAGHITFVES